MSLTQTQLRERLRQVDDPISLMLGISGVAGFLVFVAIMTAG
jgi:hypothetical protein